MPQFELTYYLSQAFWMMISFGFLYLIMAYLICPMLEDVLAERERLIHKNLDEADSLRQKADALMQRHQVFMTTMEQDKTKRVQDAFRKMRQQAATAERRNDRALQRRVQKTEEKLAEAGAVLARESDRVAVRMADELSARFFVPREGAS